MSWATAGLLSSLPSWVSRTPNRRLFLGFILGVSFSWSFTAFKAVYQRRKENLKRHIVHYTPKPIELRSDEVVHGVIGLIGNTPLVRINSLSDALGVEILAKAEFLNPGGSVKDRVALQMIEDAERLGYLQPHTGSRIFEGTVGSTGISLATVARARGYDATIVMPDDVAGEKVKALIALGADVERVRPASIVDKKQYVNLAKRRAEEFGQHCKNRVSGPKVEPHILQSPSESVLISTPSQHVEFNNVESIEEIPSMKQRGYFADQFENKSNFDAHFNGTGPEIWSQTGGRIDAFVAGAGTGGTVAGVGRYLKSKNEDIYVAIADPEGSGLFNKVKYGVMYDQKESEGTKRRHQVDTVVEGIGINRVTRNIELALLTVDDAFRISDAEAVSMSRYLVKNDGLFLGSSSACNLVACVKLVKQIGWSEKKTIVTILCDSGNRHYSKFWNDDYLRDANIPIDLRLVEDLLGSAAMRT